MFSLFLAIMLALSDAAALGRARSMWDGLAMIGTIRDESASNWTRQVGIATPACALPFTVFGSGFNTWDAAFSDVMAHPPLIDGPFKAVITVNASAWDNVGVSSFQFYIDNQPFAVPVVVEPPVQQLAVAQAVDTVQVGEGLHVLCARAADKAGNVGRSTARMFRVDQAADGLKKEWNIAFNGKPVFSGGE